MTANQPDAGELLIRVRPEPAGQDCTGADAMVRLRRLLKRMLRVYGWRCLEVRPAAEQKTVQPAPRPDQQENMIPRVT